MSKTAVLKARDFKIAYRDDEKRRKTSTVPHVKWDDADKFRKLPVL